MKKFEKRALLLSFPYTFLVYCVILVFGIRCFLIFRSYIPNELGFLVGMAIGYWAMEFTKWLVHPIVLNIRDWCERRWGQ